MISINPWLIVTVIVIYIIILVLVLRSKSGKKVWKISFFLSLLIPVIVFFLSYTSGVSEGPSNPFTPRGEWEFAVFFGAAINTIGALIFCLPVWVILGFMAFRKSDSDKTEKPTKEEHVIEDISRDEAVARMKERHKQDAEQGNK